VKTKQLELLRDLVQIASKYKASDWQAALKMLSAAETGASTKKSSVQVASSKQPKKIGVKSRARIATPKKAIKKTAIKKAAAKKKAIKKKPTKFRPQALEKMVVIRDPTEREISLERLLMSVPPRQLKFAYTGLFQAKETPENRHQVVLEITKYLSALPEPDRAELIDRLLRQDSPKENYRRWLQIIGNDPLRK
jgi:hypothetical protein